MKDQVFILLIKMGNEAMNDKFALADKLSEIPAKIVNSNSGDIFDANGTKVGSWKFVGAE